MLKTSISRFSAVAHYSLNCPQLLTINSKMSLILNRAVIGGRWISSHTGKEFEVLNPVNGSVVGTVPDMDKVDVERAIDSAYDTFHSPEWQNMIAKERSNLLKVFYNIMITCTYEVLINK